MTLVCAATCKRGSQTPAPQVTRVQRLWEKMQELGLSDSEAFDSLPQLHLHGTPSQTKKCSRLAAWWSLSLYFCHQSPVIVW